MAWKDCHALPKSCDVVAEYTAEITYRIFQLANSNPIIRAAAVCKGEQSNDAR